ncbi:hypothetical protein EYC80_004449 [Monilinia laxa]|uniref:Uncharacterized protein n=1 Tax=Monilinia laxa TaxID=61186 RepID=A0A5N6KNE3_MONLA|nr:hypothetical protein EYC80_004449 [Monilinia laxa]
MEFPSPQFIATTKCLPNNQDAFAMNVTTPNHQINYQKTLQLLMHVRTIINNYLESIKPLVIVNQPFMFYACI